jgi:hypothetical protein
LFELGCKPETEGQKQRREILDRVCDLNQLTPRQLCDMPIEDAAQLIRNVTSDGVVNVHRLPEFLDHYADSA